MKNQGKRRLELIKVEIVNGLILILYIQLGCPACGIETTMLKPWSKALMVTLLFAYPFPARVTISSGVEMYVSGFLLVVDPWWRL